MIIIEDTRQQKGKHELKHAFWAENGCSIYRSKVIVGDYCTPPAVAIDTKESMQEIAQNIGGGKAEHQRFINELKLAQRLGTKLYILVENIEGVRSISDVPRWINPRLEYSPQAIQGPRLAKAMTTIADRYGCTFLFCRPQEAAQIITKLLQTQWATEQHSSQ
jgi:hypothetical protein